jgi:hypothetical protein
MLMPSHHGLWRIWRGKSSSTLLTSLRATASASYRRDATLLLLLSSLPSKVVWHWFLRSWVGVLDQLEPCGSLISCCTAKGILRACLELGLSTIKRTHTTFILQVSKRMLIGHLLERHFISSLVVGTLSVFKVDIVLRGCELLPTVCGPKLAKRLLPSDRVMASATWVCFCMLWSHHHLPRW